ncbi:MAG: metallopeptidase TldD-related protein [Ktedonobacterales bacterium]
MTTFHQMPQAFDARATILQPDVIAGVLAATPGVDEWQIELLSDEEQQIYLIGEHVESRRTVTGERARVTIHNDHRLGDGPLARGVTTLTLLAGDVADTTALAQRLRDAVTIASLTNNSPFSLPDGPGARGFAAVHTVDPAVAEDMSGGLEAALQRLRASVTNWSNVRLSSAELYATQTRRILRTSRGLSTADEGTRVYLDFVLLAREEGHEAEFHAELARRRFADLMIEGAVDAYTTFARHTLHATPPATHPGPVILSGEALAQLFVPLLGSSPLVFHASAQAAYRGISRFSAGDYITGARPSGDRLTLIGDATRPWGVRTAAFDEEGLPAEHVTVIEDGVFRRPWADTRYAAYLGIELTGAFGNVTVLPGRWGLDLLRSAAEGPVYEIVSFSHLSPDAISGDFTVEIRLGYRHDDRGTAPFKGGTLSGNVFDMLADARFSAETFGDGNYFGPAAIRFANLTVSGE